MKKYSSLEFTISSIVKTIDQKMRKKMCRFEKRHIHLK